ncbi:hypothetical protein PoB_007425700 [Plakobranchus ocellatus]|uniref:Uncharacterized protein n=1 Tax=Plakobranchus ocellatus TaxID=259542 RepID=A0AAV4DUQ3_9GAST|nr:hypothetical protein PoB_007425700 [Plakobranchus ocellatus]
MRSSKTNHCSHMSLAHFLKLNASATKITTGLRETVRRYPVQHQMVTVLLEGSLKRHTVRYPVLQQRVIPAYLGVSLKRATVYKRVRETFGPWYTVRYRRKWTPFVSSLLFFASRR